MAIFFFFLGDEPGVGVESKTEEISSPNVSLYSTEKRNPLALGEGYFNN